LHAYWDTTVVTHALSGHPQEAAQTLFATITPEKQRAWRQNDPDQWAQESFEVAKNVAYALPGQPELTGFIFPPQFGRPDPCGPVDVFRLTAGYEQRAEQVAIDQLAKAAIRLAFLLQQQLD
jgi:hypothetical protein